MAGMVEEEKPNPRGFAEKTPGQKMAVSFAGPAMNFVLAIIIFIYTFTFVGTPQILNNAVVGDVIEGRPAYEAGIRSGDHITTVNGVEVATWDAFTEQIREVAPGKPMEITLERKGQILELVVIPELDETRGISVIGVTAPVVFEKVGVWEGLKMGFYQTFEITWLIMVGLGQLITGAASTADLAGPVGITKMIGDAAAGGLVYLANFTALLSINLGILNLLPIPALDGSRIIFAGIESLRGRPLEPEKENMIHFLGFIFLMLLIVVVTYNDILKLFRG